MKTKIATIAAILGLHFGASGQTPTFDTVFINDDLRFNGSGGRIYWSWAERCIEEVIEADGSSRTIRFRNSMGPNYGNPLGGFEFATHSNESVLRIADMKVGIGQWMPKATLHLGQSNPELRFDYNGTDAHYGSLRWSGLQLGSNEANRIVAGRTLPGGRLEFFVNNTNEGANYQATPNGILALLLAADGNVGIGTTNAQNKLDVNGTVRAKEVIVESANWPDYVFNPDYRLRPLHEVEAHIAESGHLPDVPPAAVVESEGLSLGEAQKIMMQKIEELTLYVIEQNKKIEAQQALLSAQQRELEALKASSVLP